jgi:hypothetical protein
LIVVHEDIQPQTISRLADDQWELLGITFEDIPQHQFNDGASPTPITEVQQLNFTNASEGDLFRISLQGVLTEDIAYSLNRNTTENNIKFALLDLPITADSGITVASTSSTLFQVSFADESADDYDEMSGVAVRTKSTDFEILTTTIANGAGKGEDVWSSLRGWPKTVTFHESRLWFGGSRSRPQTLWASRIGSFFNFRNRKSLDNESIDLTLDTDRVNAIVGIISNKQLQIFTSGGEFYIPERPITPTNISVPKQTEFGAASIRPAAFDGNTYYVQRTGRSVRRFVFSDERGQYESNNASLLSTQVIKLPTEMAVTQRSGINDANYLLIVNGFDGTVAVFNSLAAEGVSGWTRWETDGEIISIASLDEFSYFIVKRTNSGGDYFSIEKELDPGVTDSYVSYSGAPTTVITGLDHLEGLDVRVIGDGVILDNEVVAGGQITLEKEVSTAEVGLNYEVRITTMPLTQNSEAGFNAALEKRIVRVAIDVLRSNGIVINGERLTDRTVGDDPDTPLEPFTGKREIWLQGWTIEAKVSIEQPDPLPLQLLNIGSEVSV